MPEDCGSGVDVAAASLGPLGRPTGAVEEAREPEMKIRKSKTLALL